MTVHLNLCLGSESQKLKLKNGRGDDKCAMTSALRDQYLLGRELSRLCRPPGYPVRIWSKFTLESDLAVGAREPGCRLLGNNARSGE